MTGIFQFSIFPSFVLLSSVEISRQARDDSKFFVISTAMEKSQFPIVLFKTPLIPLNRGKTKGENKT
jgi:hypothetical protein